MKPRYPSPRFTKVPWIPGILLVVAALPTTGFCQSYEFAAFAEWLSAFESRSQCVAVGDLNRDGYLDFVFGGSLTEGSVVYLSGSDGSYNPNPDWTLAPSVDTRSIAVGDVDSDGNLDLVFGNRYLSNTVYLNTDDGSVPDSAWASEPANATHAVALGDVDGDGDLDLVCGNRLGANCLYKNDGGVFSLSPDWISEPSFATESVALGDVDQDGDLDLVCGNAGNQSNTLYRFEDGTFGNAPAWSSDSQNDTRAVALGDVDGDGDLDLVCGNRSQRNTLYLNNGEVFATTPYWECDAQSITSSVTLGDVDLDGDLDLVFGNRTGDRNTMYLNEGGAFAPTPSWSQDDDYETSGVALADVGSDGDLDLVLANLGNPDAIYMNDGAFIEKVASWSGGNPDDRSVSVALGDVNGDGRPDMAFGNTNSSNRVFFSDGDAVDTVAGWSSNPENPTWDVVLAEIDDVPGLDLICANYREPNTLYSGQSGSLQSDPIWSSNVAYGSVEIAVGDLDGDGFPEVVFANRDDANTVYWNNQGQLETGPRWVSADSELTQGVAIGDVDHDGDLDVIFGNFQGLRLYENVDGELTTEPVWSSGFSDNAISTELGDADGDGWLDLAVARNPGQSVLYLNTRDLNAQGSFGSAPYWTAGPQDTTTSVQFADADGDGMLDLFFARALGRSTLYLNDRGVYPVEPTRFCGSSHPKFQIAVADLDLDGDVDLIEPNGEGYANEVHHGVRFPPLKDLPGSVGRPNNGAHLRSVRLVETLNPNLQRITFLGVDRESDPIWLIGDYQYEGNPEWIPIGPGRYGPFTTSPDGTEQYMVWNVRDLPFDPRNVVIRLRTTEIPQSVSLIQHAPTYRHVVGPIDPLRPQIAAIAGDLSFPTVTVGDTVGVTLTIENEGSASLTISHITLPSSEMMAAAAIPCTIDASDVVDLDIEFFPTSEHDGIGEIGIESNDPLTPTLTIPVEMDVRTLDFSSTLLTDEEEVELGEALTLVVAPAPLVRIERGAFLYRIPGGDPTFSEILLIASADIFIASIPGDLVTELGLEYYVKVENSGLYATDPPGAPDDSLITIDVRAPALVVSQPQPNSGLGYLEGREVRILVVEIEDGTIVESGTLHYRRCGESEYVGVDLALDGSTWFATIPDSVVGPRGVGYWLEITTQTGTILTDPPTDPLAHSHVIRVTVPNLAEATMSPGEKYRMVSVPLDFGDDFTGTLEALLSDQDVFGPYDPTRWRAFRHDPSDGEYVELPDTTRADIHVVRPGSSFWLVSRDPGRIETAPLTGTSTFADASYPIELAPGWNQIGHPFAFSVPWDSVRVDTLFMADAESTVVEPLVGWVIAQQTYDIGVDVLEAFEGYWVKNLTDSTVVLHVPPHEAPPVTTRTPFSIVAQTNSDESWRLAIRAVSEGVVDADNVVGVDIGAVNRWDAHDRSEPPLSPGPALSLYFPHADWEHRSGPYTVDIRGNYEDLRARALPLPRDEELWGHVWAMDVAKTFTESRSGDEVRLEIDGLSTLPVDARVCLVDRHLERVIDLRADVTHIFYLRTRDRVSSEEEARFLVIVGSETFIDNGDLPEAPLVTTLQANHPNPFNPRTIVTYDIAEPGEATLSVFSATGARVCVLKRGHHEPGRYEIAWDGKNAKGITLASGVYFYRLRTAQDMHTRKMVMLR